MELISASSPFKDLSNLNHMGLYSLKFWFLNLSLIPISLNVCGIPFLVLPL